MSAENKNARGQPGVGIAINLTAKHTAHPSIKQRAKNLIIGLACWGLLPIIAADFLICRLHLEAE